MHATELPSTPAWHAPVAGARNDVPTPGRATVRGLRSLVSPAALTGSLTELAWVGAHVLMYPLGTWTEDLP